MANGIFGFGPMGALPDAQPVKPEDKRRTIEGIASQHQIPANVLMALDEAGIADTATVAQKIAADIKTGKTIDQIVGPDLMNRAYDIADQLYPRPKQEAPKTEPNALRDIPAGMAGAAISGTGSALDYIGAASGRSMGIPDENVTFGEYLGDKLHSAGKYVSSFVSEDAAKGAENSTPSGDILHPSTWKAPEDFSMRGALQLMAQGVGSMAPVVLSALVSKNPSIVSGVVGGAMGGGDGRQTAAQIIDEKWQTRDANGISALERESDIFASLVAGGMPKDKAYVEVRNRSMNSAGDLQAIVAGLGGAVTGKLVSTGLPSALAGKTVAGNMAHGVAASAVEEGIQEAAETTAARTGVNAASNLGLNPTEGTLDSAFAGAVGGGPMGALAGLNTPQSEQNTAGDGSAGGQGVVDAMGLPGPDAPAAPANMPPEPTGPIGRAAAVAPDLTPQPEVPPPAQFFPDQKPGAEIKLYDPEAEVTHNAVFLGEGPDGVSVRVAGEEITLTPQEFDESRNEAIRLEEEAKAAAKGGKKPKAEKPAAPPVPAAVDLPPAPITPGGLNVPAQPVLADSTGSPQTPADAGSGDRGASAGGQIAVDQPGASASGEGSPSGPGPANGLAGAVEASKPNDPLKLESTEFALNLDDGLPAEVFTKADHDAEVAAYDAVEAAAIAKAEQAMADVVPTAGQKWAAMPKEQRAEAVKRAELAVVGPNGRDTAVQSIAGREWVALTDGERKRLARAIPSNPTPDQNPVKSLEPAVPATAASAPVMQENPAAPTKAASIPTIEPIREKAAILRGVAKDAPPVIEGVSLKWDDKDGGFIFARKQESRVREALGIGTEPKVEPAPISKPVEAKKPDAEATAKPKQKQIGTNASGKPLFEDLDGVRSYVDGGMRVVESVRLVPGSGFSVSKENRSGDFLTEAERAPGPEPVAAQAADPASKPAAKITDFGEKIGGARKDVWSGFKEKLSEAENLDTADEPLSKSWPEPDYEKLIEGGVDPWTVAFLRSARDYIPRKPTKSWKLKDWAASVTQLRSFANKLMAGAIDKADLIERMKDYGRLNAEISGRISLYEAVGHAKSLKDLKFGQHSYSVFEGQLYSPNKTFWEVTKEQAATAFNTMPRTFVRADTQDEAIAKFKEIYATLEDGGAKKGSRDKGTKFILYRYRNDPAGAYRVGVKIGKNHVDLRTGIADVKEARRIVAEEAEQLQVQLDQMKDIPRERRDENAPRIGVDHRSGADVTPEMFANAFGFRGVEFGNWVEADRRQEDLNNAFDAMMDLASILDLPSKAMSLNGSLGLAFGARGSGGKNPAAAHYEPGKVVINLTKRQGRGSLAHEWFHALDNYFARKREQIRGTYITDNAAPGASAQNAGVRPEVIEAFLAVKRAIMSTDLKKRSANIDKMRSDPYWGTGIEMHARAFESYVIAKLQDQSASNDYLANVVSGTSWGMQAELSGLGDSFPYLKDSEIEVVRPAIDALFQTIETRETDSGVEMYSRFPEGQEPADMDSAFAAEIMAELAAVDDLFQNPRTSEKTLKGVFAEVDPSVQFVGKVKELDDQGNPIDQDKTLLRTAEGEDHPAFDFYVYQTDKEVWIDVSNLKTGTAGSRIYAAVADYAFNTGRVFIGDPEGLTLKALRRRTDAMLSSALKHGTTKHLAPHDYQITGDAARNVPPLVWTEGDDLANVKSLIEVSVANAIHLAPQIAESTYDFDTGAFRDVEGEPISDEMLDGWASAAGGVRAARTGRNTLKRGILLNTLAHAESGQRPGLLERALRQSGTLVARGLRGTFYSRTELDPASAPVATLTGDELGDWEDIRQLGRKVDAWYRANLIGKTVINADTGMTVGFRRDGAKKVSGRKGDVLMRIVPALQQIIENGVRTSIDPDTKGNSDVVAWHTISATVMLEGTPRDVVVKIKETRDGQFHYDLSRDMSDGARHMVASGRTVSDAIGLEDNPVEINLDYAKSEINESVQPVPVAALRDISAALAAEVKASGLEGKVSPALVRNLLGSAGVPIQGRQAGAVIEVSAASTDPVGVMRHEIVHALRDAALWGKPYGLFTAEEWRELVKVARADAELMARVKKAYADKSESIQIEEAVAEMYREWAGARAAAGPMVRAFNKIAAFFRAFASALRGEGFTDAAMIMERIAGGAVGGRGPDGGGRRKRSAENVSDMERRNTATPEFSKWFGASKVVDANGKPLVVYHGTRKTFEAFNAAPAKSRLTSESDARMGFFFSLDADVAGTYAADDGMMDKVRRAVGSDKPRVESLYLSIQNPFAFDMRGRDYSEQVYADVIRAAKDAGHDGVLIKNVKDDGFSYTGKTSDVWVAFRPAQIKSVNNRGTFNPDDPRMMEMRGGLIKAQDKFKGMVGSRHWKNPGDFVSNLITDAMAGKGGGENSTLALVPGRALFSELGKRINAARAYLREKEEMDSQRNDWHARADKVAQRWLAARNKNPDANDKLMDLMHRSTLEQVDPSMPDTWKHAFDAPARREVSALGDDAPDWAKDAMRQIEKHEAAYAKLSAEFNALPQEFRQIYRTVKGGYDALGDAFEQAVLNNIKNATRIGLKRAVREHEKEIARIRDEALQGEERDEAIAAADAKLKAVKMRGGFAAKARMAALRKKFESNKLKGPYFPLARFGDYFVTLRDGDGAVTSFSRFEKEGQQQAWIRALQERGETNITFGTLDSSKKKRNQIDPSFVANIENMLAESGATEEVMDAVWQHWLETLPDQSIRTSKIHRKGRSGYGNDAFRAFGKHMFHGAHQLARLDHGLLLEEHLNDAEEEARKSDNPNRAGLLVAEMRKRHDFTMNPSGSSVVASMSGAAFVWYLGASPAAALANISQTTVVGIPIMSARFGKAGVSGVTKALGRASKDFFSGRGAVSKQIGGVPVWTEQWTAENSPNLTDEERAAMHEAVRRGTIDKTQAHDLASVAETGIEYSATRGKWMRRIGWFFHQAERFNREVTFLANYRLAKADGLNHAAAIDLAADLTWKIHFDYQNCVDGETEILTLQGWKQWDQIKAGDRIISTDDDGKAVEIGVQEVNVFHRQQEIALFSARGPRNFTMAVTDDHKCVVMKEAKNKGKRGFTKPYFELASKLDHRHHILRSPIASIDRPESIGVDMAAIIGWFVAEGWYARNRGSAHKHSVRIEQSVVHNPEHVAEIDAILTRLGGQFSRHGAKGGRHVLWSITGELGRAIRQAVPDKLLTWELFAKLNADEMGALLDAFAKADGTLRGKNGCVTITQKASTNRQNIDVLQAMATAIGKTAAIWNGGTRDTSWLIYTGNGVVQNRKTAVRVLEQSRLSVPMVWCPTTDNGRWIARRNGMVFVTGNTSRPRFMQNDLGKVLTTFRQFTVNLIWRMFRDTHQMLNGATKEDRREARLQLVGVTLSMMAHAGIRGTWGYGLLMMLMGILAPGADDDDIKEWLQDALLFEGDSLGVAAWNYAMGAALNGVPGQVLGVDLVERIGMPNLWFRDAPSDLEGKDLYSHYVGELLGPVYGIGEGFFRGEQLAADGNWWRGTEAAVPKVIRDGLKTVRYLGEGVQTLNGDILLDGINPYQALLQVNGFTPAKIAERYDINSRLKDQERKITGERTDIQKEAAAAILAGQEVPESVMEQIKEFNARFPEYPITSDTIRQSARSKLRAQERSEFGITLNAKLNDRLRAERATEIYN